MTSRMIATGLMASIAAIAVAAVAIAAGDHHAKTYRAALAAVDPAATTAGVAHVAGKAQLVDGKRRNKVSLHMRHLAPRTMYLWHVHEGTCAATGAPVPGWTYRTHDAAGNGTLTSNAAGNANSRGRSATFDADPSKSYSVNVHIASPTNGLAAGTIIACGDLRPNHGKPKPKQPHPPHGKHPKS